MKVDQDKSLRMEDYMNEQTNEQTNGQTKVRTNDRTKQCTNEQKNATENERKNARTRLTLVAFSCEPLLFYPVQTQRNKLSTNAKE